jgi:hypothetical protein
MGKKWRQASGVLCDKKVQNKLKVKFYMTAIRPTMMYGAECWATKGQHVQKMSVAEIIEVSILRFKIRILRYDTIQRLIDTNLTIRYNSKTNKYKSALFVYGEEICMNP